MSSTTRYLGRDTSAAPNTWTLGVELNGENHELVR